MAHEVLTGYAHETAYDEGHLKVDDIHEIYYGQYGKKDGLPVIFLHGGPGGCTSFMNTKFFDPAVYRVVLLDQRGVGKSRPRNELRGNTTQHLSDDIERLRVHLGLEKWHMVFGGSWGSTLGLFYAQQNPERVHTLVLRGIFVVRRSELFVRGEGEKVSVPTAALLFPREYDAFLNYLPESERGDPWAAYHARITSTDRAVAVAAAREWNRWDLYVGTLRPDLEDLKKIENDDWSLTHALLESHYLYQNGAWMEDGELLRPENMAKIAHIPGAIVQGRYDVVCPPRTAWDLHKAWPGSSIDFIDDAGHSPYEPGMTAKLVEICDKFAQI